MTIAVCGCGWLGFPLARELVGKGLTVIGTRRHSSDFKPLLDAGIVPIPFALGDALDAAILAPLFQAKVLVLNIPFGRRSAGPEDFVSNIRQLLVHAGDAGVTNLIVVSTTSVYGEAQGEVTESQPPTPVTPSAIANLAIEELGLELFGENACVIRLSGLVGRDRHPVKFLAGKTGLGNGDAPVNLVHQDDAVQAIIRIIELGQYGGQRFHLSSEHHPSRKDYYQWAAQQSGLTAPQFLVEKGTPGKTINARRSLAALQMTMRYPSPFDMIEDSPAI